MQPVYLKPDDLTFSSKEKSLNNLFKVLAILKTCKRINSTNINSKMFLSLCLDLIDYINAREKV